MKEKLNVSLIIQAPTERVWQGLTDPQLVKQYFFGTQVVTDWQQESPIFFRGEWNGKAYEDKGKILSASPGRHVAYSYWSSMSGEADLPENYNVVAYDLEPKDGGTQVTITQETTPEKKDHSARNWRMVLEGLKKLVEKKAS